MTNKRSNLAYLFRLLPIWGAMLLLAGCPPPAPRTVYHSTELLWSYATGDSVETTPAVVDGVVYFGSADHHVYAVNAASGELLWRYETDGPVFSSPTVADGTVFVGSDDHHLHALDAASGELLWTYETGILRQQFGPGPQVRSTPVVAAGMVYFDSGDGNLHALDAVTGDLRWHAAPGDVVSSSPNVMNGVVYIGGGDEHLYALDAASGETLWRYAINSNVYRSPAVSEGVVYVSSVDWSSKDQYIRVYALQADSGEQIWSTRIGAGIGDVDSTPIVAGGAVYVASRVGIYALDAATGELLQNFQTIWSESAPSVVGGVIYAGDVFALSADSGEVIWHNEIDKSRTYSLSGVHAQPSQTVVDGVVYVGSYDGHIYALAAATAESLQEAAQRPSEESVEAGHESVNALWRFRTNGSVDAPPPQWSMAQSTSAQWTSASTPSTPPAERCVGATRQGAVSPPRLRWSMVRSTSAPETATSTLWMPPTGRCAGAMRQVKKCTPPRLWPRA